MRLRVRRRSTRKRGCTTDGKARMLYAIAVTFPDTPWVYALSKQPPPRFQAGSDTELCYC